MAVAGLSCTCVMKKLIYDHEKDDQPGRFRQLLALVNDEPWDAFEVTDVAGDNDEFVMEGSRANQDVRITNQLSATPKIATYASEPLHDGLIQRKNLHES